MKKINFRTKMAGLLIIVLAVFFSLGYIMQATIKAANAEKRTFYEGSIVPLHQLSQLNADLLSKVQIPVQRLRSEGISKASAAYQLRTAMKDVRSRFLKIRSADVFTPDEQVLLSRMSAGVDKLFGTVENILNFQRDISNKDNHLQWQKLFDNFNQAVQKFQADASAFTSLKAEDDQKMISNIDHSFSEIHRWDNTILFVGFLTILLLSILFIIDITKKYKLVIKYLTTLSKGDLTDDIPDIAHDEMGWILRNVRILQKSLRKTTVEINTTVGNLSIASHDLSASSQSIAQGASQQASSVEEVSSSVEELASNIHQVADNATATENIVIQLSETTNQMVKAARASQEKMDAIAEKIGIISEIAFQTNILALNAAVEAARAGEHGRGFGVVAVEVGKLAERSKKASSEIESLIHDSAEVIENAGKLMLDVAPEVSKTANMVKSISEASLEQKLGADQINDAIQQLNEVTQQNAAASEEIATSAEELSAQADRLLNTQAFFKLKDEDLASDTPENVVPRVRKRIPQAVTAGQKVHQKKKGVDIDLREQDDLDEGYERF